MSIEESKDLYYPRLHTVIVAKIIWIAFIFNIICITNLCPSFFSCSHSPISFQTTSFCDALMKINTCICLIQLPQTVSMKINTCICLIQLPQTVSLHTFENGWQLFGWPTEFYLCLQNHFN